VASSWDTLSAPRLAKLQDDLVRDQVQHVVHPFSPYWKERFTELGKDPATVDGVTAVATLPAVGERDVSPNGDPAGMATLVVRATESGFALHAQGPTLRRALRLRLTRPEDYRQLVEHDTKPTSYVWSGLGFRYPVASTRADLDVVARAGARLWAVLGLTADDALLSAVPVASTTEHVGLYFAAMAAGAPALFPGAAVADVVAAARLASPTVLAVPAASAGAVLAEVLEAGASLDRLRKVLLVGAPSEDERAAAAAALVGHDVVVLAVHAPSGARVLWGECPDGGAGAGFHTYPDIDLVQLVDPETVEPVAEGGELVLTQLGLRGTALLRWRTGDVSGSRIDPAQCPGCRRTVPRVRQLRRGALVLHSDDGRALDLRAVAGALSGRTDLADWRVLVGGRSRDGRGQVLVHFAANGDPGEAAVGAAADIRTLAGLLPTQLVAVGSEDVALLDGERLTRRILRRH